MNWKRLAVYLVVMGGIAAGFARYYLHTGVLREGERQVLTRKVPAPDSIQFTIHDSAGKTPEHPTIHALFDEVHVDFPVDAAGKALVHIPTPTPTVIRFVVQADHCVPQMVYFRWFQPIPDHLDYALASTAMLSGRILFADQIPVKDVHVKLSAPNTHVEEAIGPVTTQTDAEGRWSCDAFPENIGPVSFTIESPAMTPPSADTKLTDADMISMRAGAFVQQVERRSLIKGRILLPDGSPALGNVGELVLNEPEKNIVLGAHVANASSQTAQSNPDGTYEIHPNFKTFRLVLQHPAGYAIAMSEDLATDPDLRLVPWSQSRVSCKSTAPPLPLDARSTVIATVKKNLTRRCTT
jgi:hypothetical protein